jgi:hypothetical protein
LAAAFAPASSTQAREGVRAAATRLSTGRADASLTIGEDLK